MTALAGLRIGVVTRSLALAGGTEVYVQRLVGAQQQLGAQTSVFTDDGAPQAGHFDLSGALNESLHPLHRASAACIRAAADAIAARCDMVEFHGSAPTALLQALRGRLPVLLYAHTAELTCPAGGRILQRSGGVCSRAPGVACLGVDLSQGCLSGQQGEPFAMLQKLRAPLRGKLSRQAVALAWAVVFNSYALEGLFHATVGVPGRSYVLQPPLPQPQPVEVDRAPQRLLFSGRLQGFKGLHEAIALCAALPATQLAVAGTGPAESGAKQQVERLGIADRVQFLGWLDGPSLAREMARASCLLMPGRWFEAWGMTGPEAVAQGCGVAAFDVGGVREWCRQPWGSLVPAGNEPALRQAVQARLAENPPPAQRAQWAHDVQSQWGAQAFAARYAQIAARAQERAKARRVVKVIHFERAPGPGYYSIENLFATVRRNLPGDIDVAMVRAPWVGRGVLRRLLNLRFARKLKAEVVHVVGDAHYLVLGLQPQRAVLTIHDCVNLVRSSGLKLRLIRKYYFERPMERATAITVISPRTQRELEEFGLRGAHPTAVIANCVSDRFETGATHKRDGNKLLMIGTLPHKNLERAVNALRGGPWQLHVVGGLSGAQRQLLADSGLDWRNSVGLDDGGMIRAYLEADVLVFASLYEGFGMPVVEAQAAGLPVVTSSIEPLNWVAGDGALLVDPRDGSQIRAAVQSLSADPELRARLVTAGSANLPRFAPAHIAGQYAAIYRNVAADARAPRA